MVVYHVTTWKKLHRYMAHGSIKAPVRAWKHIESAERFSKQTGRRGKGMVMEIMLDYSENIIKYCDKNPLNTNEGTCAFQVVCPYCGYMPEDWEEHLDAIDDCIDHKCDNCGKVMMLHAEKVVEYYASKKDPEDDEQEDSDHA